MNFITIENVSKSFGEKVLFENITLRINQGDKIALIAKNGSGKTTLLRIINGDEAPEGERANLEIARDLRIGYLEQDPPLDGAYSIWENILMLDHPKIQAYSKYHTALENGDEAAIEKGSLEMDDRKAWDVESEISELFHKLSFKDLSQQVNTLSGGQKKRVALGMMILEEPQMLILDEPTNHLDVEMIEWLEEYLQHPDLALLMVTHDRYFLDRVCNEILEIYQDKLYKYRGNYSQYLEKKAVLEETESVRMDKARKLMKKELEWIRRMPKARTTKNKARIDSFEELKAETARAIYDDPMKVEIDMTRLGSKILEMHNVSFSFGDIQILKNFDYKFKKADRVGVIGPNGVGKSSFVKLLIRELRPTSGKIVSGDTLRIGYYDQGGLQLEKDRRVIDVIRDVAEYLPLKGGYKLHAEQLLERFLFTRGQQQVYYSQLSGGEKRRLYLLTVLMDNPNFIILDEPTNDLDIITLNVLEEFLLQYQGCLMIISHDRYMIDKLVDHLFVFEGNGVIKNHPGGYSRYREWKLQQLALPKGKSKSEPVSAPSDSKIDYEKRKEIKRVESAIDKLEKQKVEIQNQFLNPSLNVEELQQLHQKLKDLEDLIEEKEIVWMALTDEL
jgi:ATP-binding cassette subfamily F protein uup